MPSGRIVWPKDKCASPHCNTNLKDIGQNEALWHNGHEIMKMKWSEGVPRLDNRC